MATQINTDSTTSPLKKKTNETYTKSYSSSFAKTTLAYKPNLQRSSVDPEKQINTQTKVNDTTAKKELLQENPQQPNNQQTAIKATNNKITIEDNKEKEHRLLKQLSSQVKSSLKRNQDSVHNHTNDIFILKKQNQKLQAIINEYKGRTSIHQSLLNEQNKYLKEYIGKGNSSSKKEQVFKKPQGKEYITDGSESTIASLKKYIITYINTITDRNDDKIAAQQKQMEQLETRIRKLSKLENHLQHLKFQKTVKLQESTRKTKNITVGVIKNNGDRLDYDVEDQQQPIIQRKMFKNPYKLQLQGQSKEMAEQNSQLYQSLCKLQEKYQLQKQSHLIDLAEKEELLNDLARINQQNKNLKHSIFDLGERLKFSQQKQNELQSYVFNKKQRFSGKIERNIGFSLRKELTQLKNQLKISGADKYSNIERQIISIIIDRNYLRKQITDIQDFIEGGSKLSATHREVFHLREKNHQLQLKCKEYERQLAQYFTKTKVGEENNDLKKDVVLEAEEEECLKLTRLMHFCIMSSINKLDSIQAQMQVPSV